MRCTIFTVGTRGDVEPLIAVGVGLRAAGVDVRVAAQRDFAATVEQHGLEYFPVHGQSASFFRGAAGIALRERLKSRPEFERFFNNYLALGLGRILDDFWAASREADVVLAWMNGGQPIAERLGIPVFVCGICPLPHLPTTAFPNPFLDAPPGPPSPLANRRSWRANELAARTGEAILNRWRRETLDLPPIGWRDDLARMRRLPHLLGYSSAVLPRPRDWQPWVHVTGYWFLEDRAAYHPPPALQAFLDAGAPPLAIGFSSLVGHDPAGSTRAVVDALTRTGQRAVMLTGLGGLQGVALPDHVFPIAAVPHHWLFPRISAMVHHGGAGTTGAAMRHGLPQLGIPFGYDQMLWSSQVQALGVGPAPIAADALSAERLAPALRELVSSSHLRANAQAISARVRAEDGVANAVSIILETAQRRVHRATVS
jgi:UDP:flavonoid glycosyltransferase YjiC (YdhE family)